MIPQVVGYGMYQYSVVHFVGLYSLNLLIVRTKPICCSTEHDVCT